MLCFLSFYEAKLTSAISNRKVGARLHGSFILTTLNIKIPRCVSQWEVHHGGIIPPRRISDQVKLESEEHRASILKLDRQRPRPTFFRGIREMICAQVMRGFLDLIFLLFPHQPPRRFYKSRTLTCS